MSSMAAEALEERLAVVESELAQIKRQLAAEKPQTNPAAWERIFGSFAESVGFEEATRLGREYREAQRLMLIVIGVFFAVIQAFAAPIAASVKQKPSLAMIAQGNLIGGDLLGDSNQIYPFRDAYPYVPPFGNSQAHALLNVAQTHIRQVRPGADPSGELFTVDIRFYSDTGESHSYYNLYWNRLIPLPGRLALYDSHKHYVCDLLESMGGSRSTISGDRDWTQVPASSYMGMILYVSLPYPTYITLSPGRYYLQVIYLPCVAQSVSESNQFSVNDHTELFRSNVVPVMVEEQPSVKTLKHELKP